MAERGNCFEAQAWMQRRTKSKQCVCVMNAGHTAGWANITSPGADNDMVCVEVSLFDCVLVFDCCWLLICSCVVHVPSARRRRLPVCAQPPSQHRETRAFCCHLAVSPFALVAAAHREEREGPEVVRCAEVRANTKIENGHGQHAVCALFCFSAN